MSYKFLQLPQLVDHRNQLPNKGTLRKRRTALNNLIRAWHQSLTLKHLAGSNALGFANFHVFSLGWARIGYAFVIEPQNIINTPNGRRARIVYANDITDVSFHVGNSNDFALGICVAGDYRYEDLDDPTTASMIDLHQALKQDNIGKDDKSHHEFPGYAWKQCCVFDYQSVLSSSIPKEVVIDPLPEQYIVQPGDTLWGLANNDDRFTVEDLMKWNNITDPSKLRVGQKLYLKPQTKVDSPTPAAATIKWTGSVKVPTLNVRKGPSVSYPVVRQLTINNPVSVYEEKNGWLNIGNGQWVSNIEGKYVSKSTQASSKRFLNLDPSIDSWNVYPLNKAPVRGNEIGKLNPKKFKGLSYEILGSPQTDVYTIQTTNFGRVNIFASKQTKSTITSTKKY